jgi:hypothetical protein
VTESYRVFDLAILAIQGRGASRLEDLHFAGAPSELYPPNVAADRLSIQHPASSDSLPHASLIQPHIKPHPDDMYLRPHLTSSNGMTELTRFPKTLSCNTN